MNKNPEDRSAFMEELFSKAESYFATRHSGPYADGVFFLKAFMLVAVYIMAWIFLVFYARSIGGMLLAGGILGICHVFIPVNIAHDAIHGAVSKSAWVNGICLYAFELTGGNHYMYAKKHLEAHGDLENGSKKKVIETQALLIKGKKQGRSVDLHAIFYVFYAQYMLFVRDFVLFFTSDTPIPKKEFVKLFLCKTAYIAAFLIVPFLVNPGPWWQIASGILFMYLVMTAVLMIILLMPTEKMTYSRNDGGAADARWVMEVLEHNVDFSPRTRELSLLAGGSNLNVVHHLFPEVCHVHYARLSRFVEESADRYGLVYRKQLVIDVFSIHLRYLREIGKPPAREQQAEA